VEERRFSAAKRHELMGASAPVVTGGGRSGRLPEFFDSLIANLWRFQSCATTESSKSYVKKGTATAQTFNLVPASIIRRIIVVCVAASSRPISPLKRKEKAGIRMADPGWGCTSRGTRKIYGNSFGQIYR
jgi:hypothetical protein